MKASAAVTTPLARVVWVVTAATTAQTIASMGSSMLPVIAPKLAEGLRIDPAWIGMQVSIVYACGAFAALFAGGLVKRLGACRTLQLALTTTACGAAVAMIPAIPAIALGSTLLGASIGIINSPAAQLLARFSPPSQLNLIFSIKQTGVPLGFTLTALIAPVVAISWGWQWSLAVLLATATLLVLALQRARADWDDDRVPDAPLMQSPFLGLAAIWGVSRLRYLVLSGCAFSAIQISVASFSIIMLVGEVGHGLIFAGFLMSLVTLSGVATRLVFGWIADRTHAGILLLAVMAAGMIVGCLLLGLLDDRWSLTATTLLFLLLGMSVIGWNGILHAEVARNSPAGTVSLTASGISTLMYGANAIVPTAAALLYQVLGKYTSMFAALSVCAIAGLWLLRAATRSR
jgi:MFS family permease